MFQLIPISVPYVFKGLSRYWHLADAPGAVVQWAAALQAELPGAGRCDEAGDGARERGVGLNAHSRIVEAPHISKAVYGGVRAALCGTDIWLRVKL